jgi:hypothetical protein
VDSDCCRRAEEKYVLGEEATLGRDDDDDDWSGKRENQLVSEERARWVVGRNREQGGSWNAKGY